MNIGYKKAVENRPEAERKCPGLFLPVRKNKTGAALPQPALLRAEALVIAQADHVLERWGSRRQVVRIQELSVKEIVTSWCIVNRVTALEHSSVVLRVVHADHRSGVVDR